MRRLAREFFYPLMLLVTAALPALRPAAAQEVPLSQRGPRFLQIGPAGGAPVEIDARSSAVLRRVVSVRLERPTVGGVLAAIERQTGLRFAFTRELVPPDRPVRIRADSISVAAALTQLLIDTDVDVLLSTGRQVTLVRRAAAVVQEGTVVGRVADAKSGVALAGAEVYLEGTRWRAMTGEDGRYRLAAVMAGGYTLAVRRVGYGKQSRPIAVAADQEATVDIALQPVATQLDELVTTVTGDQRRVELGHVVGRINADSLVREAPVSSLSELLTGRIAGLQVFQSQGTVGGEVSLRIRGPNSLGSTTEPIVVIDGVRASTARRPGLFAGPGLDEPSSPLNDLNPNDIESIEVVKGPSAATLYGTDAANGVLVITTKRGRAGPARWNAYARGTRTTTPTQGFPDIYWGWGTVTGSGSFPRNCNLDALASGRCPRQDSLTVLANPLNDPALTILAAKPRYEYGLNAAGGQQDLRYYVSGDFEDATGPVQMPPALAEQLLAQRGLSELPEEWREPNAFTKLSFRSTMTAAFGRAVELDLNTGYVRTATRTIAHSASDNAYFGGYWVDPTRSDSPYGDGSSGRLNPAAEFVATATDRTDRFLGSTRGRWRPTSWLEAHATLGLDLMSTSQYGLARPGDFPPAGSGQVINNFGRGVAEDTRARQLATTAELGAAATARRGRVSARTAVGAQYVHNLLSVAGSQGVGLPPGGKVVKAATTIRTDQRHQETVVLGGYVEEMLGLNDRLFLTGALRLDGASTFGQAFQAAVYPKGGLSWLVSEEPFLPRLPGLDELRLRVAVGASGQQPGPAHARPSYSPRQMTLNGQVVNVMGIGTLGSPALRPERVRESEFGFDAAALSNRLALDVTWFRRRTTDLILFQAGPPALGGANVNLGLVTQRGFEAQLKARVVDTRLLSWDLMLQHGSHTTTLVDFGGGLASCTLPVYGCYKEGYPLGARFQVPIFGWEDLNNNGFISLPEVRQGDTTVYLGPSTPPRSQTLTTVLGLFQSRVRLSALLERRTGFTQINPLFCPNLTCRAAVDPTTPQAAQVEALMSFYGVVPVEPGDFTRLREVTAAFDLPAPLTRAVGLRRGTLAVSARNLALWTDFSGPDPESAAVGRAGVPVSGGAAEGIPQGRTFSLRLDLGL